ncbi:arylamine N-acetyltransferase [Krasilnikovia cinnamomea]|uniref:Arylamine N-acetyltransferase n=1 Tax=Krasilnikovia cinnamomea TaxID=349313 RepID=A0A4Q7ZIK1_9ACTN|nr:arylamine N-acetyltransferase [Krasilnikovia cinnamomea]RZU50281.1 arylamine N-acetyltransferase [Krasilnikovia cinnamomea]
MSDPIDVPGYLRRLGLTRLAGQAPSVEALHELHRAHAERVPYECLEIWLGRPTSVDPAESVQRIGRGRGGYCFHLNGAFSALLSALGYRVTRHVGGVQGSADEPAGASANHLVLTVAGLPAPAAPGGQWLVDLGMGDGLHEPLPLTGGEHRQGPFRYGLRPSAAEPGGWRFDHDPRGAFLGMDFRPGAATMSAFAERHVELSTSPESGFVRVATVQRRDASGADVLRGLVLSRVGEAPTRTVLDDRRDYFAALADVFGLTLDDVTSAERAALWRRLSTAHEQWLSTQASSA